MATTTNFIQEAVDILKVLGENYRVSRLRFQLGGPGQVDLILITEPLKDDPIPLGEIPQYTQNWSSGTITLSTWDYSEAGVQSLVSRNRAFENAGSAVPSSGPRQQGPSDDKDNAPAPGGKHNNPGQEKGTNGPYNDHKYHAAGPSDKSTGSESANQGPGAKKARGSFERGFGGDNGWRQELNTPDLNNSKDYENVTPPVSPATPDDAVWDSTTDYGRWSHEDRNPCRKTTQNMSDCSGIPCPPYTSFGRGRNSRSSPGSDKTPTIGGRSRDPIISGGPMTSGDDSIPTFIITGQDGGAITAQAVMNPRISPGTQAGSTDETTCVETTTPLGLEGRALADQLELDSVSIWTNFDIHFTIPCNAYSSPPPYHY